MAARSACWYLSAVGSATRAASETGAARGSLPGAASPVWFVVLGGFLTIIHSRLEEYYWRWFVFGELQRLIPVGAVVVSGFAFMAQHVVVLASYVSNALGCSACPWESPWRHGLGLLYPRTGSIWSAWLSHLLIDAAIMIVGYDIAFRSPASLS